MAKTTDEQHPDTNPEDPESAGGRSPESETTRPPGEGTESDGTPVENPSG